MFVCPPLHVSECQCRTSYESKSYTICVYLDIGHPCYGQLTAVKIGYALTSVTCITGSGVQLISLKCFKVIR